MPKDEAFLHWLAGFVDGEGCFRIDQQPQERRYKTSLRIKLRNDDLDILLEIQERLEMGSIFFSQPSKGALPGANPQVSLTVGSNLDCLRLVEIFDEHPLRAKKRKEFEIWKEAVLEIHQGRGSFSGHKEPTYNWKRLQYLKDKLTLTKIYHGTEPEKLRLESTQLQFSFWKERN